MKTIRRFLAIMMLMISTSSVFAHPMSYNVMRDNARFLTDRMAYTLGIASGMIIDDLYRINFDFICGVNDYLDDVALGYRYDDYLAVIHERDMALRILLGERIWRRLVTFDYFYRPISFLNHRWSFRIYAYDNRHGHYYFSSPRHYADYRGGHFFRGMRPGKGHYGRTSNIRVDDRMHSGNKVRVDKGKEDDKPRRDVVDGDKGNKTTVVSGKSGNNKNVNKSSERVKSNASSISREDRNNARTKSSSRSSLSEKSRGNSDLSASASRSSKSGESRAGRR